MSSSSALQPVVEHGWSSGFMNMLRKENSLWWRTRTWWVQSLVWLLIANGLVALILWVIPALDPTASDVPKGLEILQLFIMMQGTFATIGVIVLTQGLIVNEKRFGTAAWIMSNPVSRSAFILSKLAAHGWGIFVVLVVFQSLVVYLQVSLKQQAFLNPLPFSLGMALVCLHMSFYFTLGLALGTVFNSTGPVTGISIGLLIGMNIASQILAPVVPRIAAAFPENVIKLAGAVSMGVPLPSGWLAPVLVTSILSMVFLLVAILRFRREEF